MIMLSLAFFFSAQVERQKKKKREAKKLEIHSFYHQASLNLAWTVLCDDILAFHPAHVQDNSVVWYSQ